MALGGAEVDFPLLAHGVGAKVAAWVRRGALTLTQLRESEAGGRPKAHRGLDPSKSPGPGSEARPASSS